MLNPSADPLLNRVMATSPDSRYLVAERYPNPKTPRGPRRRLVTDGGGRLQRLQVIGVEHRHPAAVEGQRATHGESSPAHRLSRKHFRRPRRSHPVYWTGPKHGCSSITFAKSVASEPNPECVADTFGGDSGDPAELFAVDVEHLLRVSGLPAHAHRKPSASS